MTATGHHTPPTGPSLGSSAGAVTRMDTHCHSSASSGAAVRALAWIDCPESFSEPERVYEQARARGMDLFTLTDHDTIAGALSLVERGFPGVAIGEEVTVFFPEDRCKLHVLVWTLSPEQHEAIQTLGLRNDVYAFARWLRDQNLPHALAHPLYVQNRRLTPWHLDRCALLFKGFETLNGAHTGTHRGALEAYLRSLTPGRVHRIIQDTGLEPFWTRIWEKAVTGGSDDHALLNIGRTWTQVEGRVEDPREFFRTVMNTRCEPGGVAGHSSLLAHQLSSVAARFVGERLMPRTSATSRYAASKLLRFAGVRVNKPAKWRVAMEHLRGLATGRRRRLDPLLLALRDNIGPALARFPDLTQRLDERSWAGGSAMSEHDRMSAFVDEVYRGVHAALAGGAARSVARGRKRDIMDHLASYVALEATQAPYLFSLFHQNKERALVERVAHESGEEGASVLDRPMRVMLFTDTLGDVNGVSRFIRNAAEQARETGRDLHVVTSTNFEIPSASNIHNFKPVFATKMPKYENLELVLPPLVQMLRFADQMQPDVIHVSTPGSVGGVGLIAAKMLHAPVLGVYHTDFPAYIEALFKDDGLTHAAQQFMRVFYSPFKAIFTRSDEYVRSLSALGIDERRTLRLKPGIRTQDFHMRCRDTSVWGDAPGQRVVRAIYVGRVSVEKNMPALSAIWRRASEVLASMGVKAELVIVGDGPYRAQMEADLEGCGVRFMGFRYGQELTTLYASSDAFVFPSTTDTLGQVVMEAQSCGLPVLVSDEGGPKEVVRDGETGHVTPARDTGLWVQRLVDILSQPERRERMGLAAHNFMQAFSMSKSFEHYWQVHEKVWVESLAAKGITPRTEVQQQRGQLEAPPQIEIPKSAAGDSGIHASVS